MLGLDDLTGPFQPKQFYESMVLHNKQFYIVDKKLCSKAVSYTSIRSGVLKLCSEYRVKWVWKVWL